MGNGAKNFFDVGLNSDFTPLMVLDSNYDIKRLNIAAKKFLNNLSRTKNQNFMGKSILNLIPELAENNRIADGVFEVNIDDKLYYLFPFRIDRENIDESIGILVIDVYSNKEQESELAYQKEITADFEEIFEGSFDGILVTDKDGKVLYVNSSYERVAEIKKSDLEGKYMRDLINPEWMPESVAHIVAREKKAVSKRQVVKSGRHIMVTGTPVFSRDGEIKKIIINVRDINEIYNLTEELLKMKENEKQYFEKISSPLQGTDDSSEQILAISEPMREVMMLSDKVANYQTTVLILGESGVGKEEVAKHIHNNSVRRDKPFITVNCGAIPATLLESELFGYEKGAFTGAMQSGKKGIIEAANGGTLFLDEIGETPLDFQVKLLRFLESKEVRRVGSNVTQIADVRIIAATNRNLADMVAEGTFREDLFYRLNVVQIVIPPLRKRKDDIMPLAALFLKRYNKKYDQVKHLTYDLVKELEKFQWPGNVRQLKNVMENMVIVSNNEYLQTEDLPWYDEENKARTPKIIGEVAGNGELTLSEAVDILEKEILQNAQKKYGSTRKMAEKLGVNQSTVLRKMQKYKLL